MKNQIYIYITVVTMLMITMLLAGCGNKTPEQGSLDVYLGGNVIEKDDSILVDGESNLLEGSRLTGKVIENDGEILFDTSELVDEKGNFTMEMDYPNYGEAEVMIVFDLLNNTQEDKIVEHYGEGGEELEAVFVNIVVA